MDRHARIADVLGQCVEPLHRVADDEPSRAGTAALAEAMRGSTPRPFEPTSLPALDGLTSVSGEGDLARAFVAIAPDLRWVPTPRSDDGGVALALAPLDLAFDFGQTTVGIMYVAEGARYPLHQHPPQELDLTIAGEGRWRYGGDDGFRPVGPQATVYNRPGDLHSAVAGRTPVVALYVLWP